MPTLPSLTPRHDRVPAAASGRVDLPWPLLITILITALACGLLAYVSIVYTRGSGRIAAVWLPNALLLAVVAGRRGLPIVAWLGPAFIANLVANLAVGDSLAMAVGLSLANTIEVAIALFALGKLKAQRPDMTSLADLMRFCAIGGIVAPACSAAVAVVILWPGSFAPAVMLWASWATTDGLGIMLFSPTLWIVADAWADRSRPSRATVLNWVAVTAFGTCVSLIVFTQHTAPLLFLMMPVVFLYAYRLGVLGTAVSILEISIIASIATAYDSGPIHLVAGDLTAKLMTLQLFLATSFAMGLPVAVFLLGRKRTLAELKDARDLGRSMLENMREVIFRTDRKGCWAFVNPAWHDLTGYTVEESIGRPTHELVHPDDLGAAVDLHRRLVAGEIDEAVIEQRFYTAAKVCRSIQANIRALRDEAGAFVGTVGNIRDVTDQQAAERALEESRQLFDTIATLSPLGIVRRGLDGSLAYCNPTWLRFAGVTAEQAYSKIWASTIHEDDRERIKTEWKAAIAARASYRTEFRYIRPDGMTWVDSIAAPDLSFDGELIGFVAVLVDITERKSLEEALVGARRHAEAGALAKSSFLANMSHEIRTPMTGVLGFADVLLNSPLDDDQRRFAQMIADSGREMMRLLNDILDLSKIEAGHMRLAKEPVDIGHMLNRCIRLMTVNAQGKGVGLRLEIEPGIPAVTGDSQRLRQIVLNLIGNALKFTDRGDVVVRALMSEDDGAGQQLTIEVEDTGIGIGEEQREAIFHPFDQGDTLTARKFGGTGLGLTICRELASAMGGEMSVESEVGRGSRFRFSMPVEASGRLPAPMLALPSVTGGAADVPRVQPLSVLLAEDLDINQLLLTTVLNRLGHAVELATDGADAIRRVERAAAEGRLFDIVLMDIQMPEVDGLAATRAIRGLGFDAAALPIVALTANAFAEDVAACLAAGMQDHLMKPLSRPALEAALTRWARPSVRLASTDCSAASQVDPELYGRYAKRKAALLHRIDAMIRDGRFDDDEAGGLASDLHKLAGVAAMFGEPEVGALAATLERNIVDWTEAEREAQLAGVAQELLKAA